MEEERIKTHVEYFLGTVVEIEDPVLYKINVDIPGQFDSVPAFPVRGEIDEPKVGDLVMLLSFDPIYHSYFLYHKLKENDFIGFRSNGKMIDITPDYLQICTFDPDTEYTDGEQGKEYRPEPLDWIKIDSEGNLDMYLRKDNTAKIDGNGTIEVTGDIEIKIGGNATITISGNAEIKVDGDTKLETSNCDVKASSSCTIDSPDVKITGAKATISGTVAPSGKGAFCGIPACLFTGAPQCGEISSGNS